MRARRRDIREAAALGRAYAGLLSPLLELGEDDLRSGLRLFERNERLGAFGAVLAAAVLRSELTALVSADRSFADVRSLPFVDLTSPDLLSRLDGRHRQERSAVRTRPNTALRGHSTRVHTG